MKSRLFCRHLYDYRDVVLKCEEHDGIDNTLFRNYYRCCTKCGKTQRGNKLPGKWGTWLNIGDMDFSKYPAHKPIENEVNLYGTPSKKQRRQQKLDNLLRESES